MRQAWPKIKGMWKAYFCKLLQEETARVEFTKETPFKQSARDKIFKRSVKPKLEKL